MSSAKSASGGQARTQAPSVSAGTGPTLPVAIDTSDVPQIENRTSSIENDKSLLGQAIVDDFRNHWTLDKLARYESRIENSMIRCLDKFKKVRESQMMNFTSLRHYYRGFTRRPQDFQDTPNVDEASPLHSDSSLTPQESSSPNVASATGGPSAVPPTSTDDFDKTNPISALSAQKTASENEITKNEPNRQAQPVVPAPEPGSSLSTQAPSEIDVTAAPSALVASQRSEDGSDAPYVSSIDKQKAALINDDFDSFSQWADLKGHDYGYDDESLEPHRSNPPSTGDYVYVENWHHKLLRMVNYPWDKRKKLDKAQLNELVDTILCGMSDPVQFLWDFGLIQLTAEAVGKRHFAAQAEEQVHALAC